MTHVQDGHEHKDAGRGAVLTLSTPMLNELDSRQQSALVEALVAVSREGGPVSVVAERLGAELERIGVPQPPTVVERMAENLHDARDLIIATDDGRVLHGDPNWSPATAEPDVDETEDPDHPDRPVWS